MSDLKFQNRLTGRLASLMWHAERTILYQVDCSDKIGNVNWKKVKNLEFNPFKGKSKESTLAVFKLLGQETVDVYKIKNIDETWHWFLIDNLRYRRYLDSKGKRDIDFIFCPTKRQYKLALTNSPMGPIKSAQFGQELLTCEHVDNPLIGENYDLRVKQFQTQLEQSLLRWKEHLSENLNDYIPNMIDC